MLSKYIHVHDLKHGVTSKFVLQQNRSIYEKTGTGQSDHIDRTVCYGQFLIVPFDLRVRQFDHWHRPVRSDLYLFNGYIAASFALTSTTTIYCPRNVMKHTTSSYIHFESSKYSYFENISPNLSISYFASYCWSSMIICLQEDTTFKLSFSLL